MRSTIKLLALVFLFGMNVASLTAQAPVKQDLIKVLEAVPAPPASSNEAFAKTGTTDADGNITCSADKVFAAIDQQVKSFNDTYVEQAKSQMTGMPAGMPGAGMTEADAERIQNMSEEQQIAMAMAMARKMSQPVQMEPPAIRAAQEAWQVLYAQTQEEFTRSAKIRQVEAALTLEYGQAHHQLDSLQALEISKLPQICGGEMSAPDPTLLKAVKLKYADKHIALADKHLIQTAARWKAEMDRIKVRNADFLKKLAACNYADGARNPSTKKILSDGQMQIFQSIGIQVMASRHAWEESASWSAAKKRIEQEKY